MERGSCKRCGAMLDEGQSSGTCEGCDPVTRYACDCDWEGTVDDMDLIDDADERVCMGELMAAGQCPECGSLIEVDDADVPDYVLRQVADIMRQRGWAVSMPGQDQAAPASHISREQSVGGQYPHDAAPAAVTPAEQIRAAAADVMAETRRFLG